MNLLEPLVRRPLFAEMSCNMNGCCQPKSAAIGSWAHCPGISVFGRLGTTRRQPQWSLKQRPEWAGVGVGEDSQCRFSNVSPMFLHRGFPTIPELKKYWEKPWEKPWSQWDTPTQHGHDRQAVQDAGQSLLKVASERVHVFLKCLDRTNQSCLMYLNVT